MRSLRYAPAAAALLLLSGGLGGCAALPAPALRQIEEADQAYRAQRYRAAEELLSPVIEAHPENPDIAEALYVRALCRLRTQRAAEARADLDAALTRARRDELIDRIHTQLGNLEFDQERYNRAAAYYAEAYDGLPDRPPKDRVGYQYGIALQRTGRTTEARLVLAEVATDFPQSEFAVKARRKTEWSNDYFAIQCGVFESIARAHAQAKTLKDQGIDAIAIPDTSVSTKRYMVRVGRYRTYAAARQALSAVQRVQPDAFIVP
ncbi:MAG: SPOR domain-containing protein [Planctomycetota bacterium]